MGRLILQPDPLILGWYPRPTSIFTHTVPSHMVGFVDRFHLMAAETQRFLYVIRVHENNTRSLNTRCTRSQTVIFAGDATSFPYYLLAACSVFIASAASAFPLLRLLPPPRSARPALPWLSDIITRGTIQKDHMSPNITTLLLPGHANTRTKHICPLFCHIIIIFSPFLGECCAP